MMVKLLFFQLVTMTQGSAQELHNTVMQNVSKAQYEQLLDLYSVTTSKWEGKMVIDWYCNGRKTHRKVATDRAQHHLAASYTPEQPDGTWELYSVLMNATGKAVLPPYCHKTNFREILNPRSVTKMRLLGWRLALPFGTGVYWICDDKAWKILNVDKDQACALGAVIPNITIFDQIEKPRRRGKRTLNPLIKRPTVFHSIVRTLLPSYEIVELERAIVNISSVIENIEKHTADAIIALQEEVHGLSRAMTQYRIALKFLLGTHEGICDIINGSCCSFVDQDGKIREDLEEIWKGTQILHEVSSKNYTLKFDQIFHALTSWLPDWA